MELGSLELIKNLSNIYLFSWVEQINITNFSKKLFFPDNEVDLITFTISLDLKSESKKHRIISAFLKSELLGNSGNK